MSIGHEKYLMRPHLPGWDENLGNVGVQLIMKDVIITMWLYYSNQHNTLTSHNTIGLLQTRHVISLCGMTIKNINIVR